MAKSIKQSKTHYVVTGLFGDTRDFGVYKAPVISGAECLFFSNSDVIGEYAQTQGWRFVKTLHPIITNDYLESSLQSKWVKYLQFLTESPIIEENLGLPKSVLYFDHKFHVTSEHVAEILKRDTSASILIRKTPVAKNAISTEINAALPYERYARNMEPTKAFINAHLAQGAKNDVTICNTGLIHYQNLKVSRDLANRVYNTCQSLKQPECQIVWAVHAQNFGDKIDVIEWNDPLVGDIEWQDPKVYQANSVANSVPKQHEPGHGIMVAGFHRSGTSSVAGLLHDAGVSAGTDLMDGNEDNAKGYYESWELVNLHDALMSGKGVDWATSLEQRALLSENDLSKLRSYFERRASCSDSAWCMKDPRIGRYVFEWKRAAPEIKTLLLYRLPNASALSLLRRSLRDFAQTRGTLELPRRFYDDPDFALRLWVEHNEEYVRFCKAHPEDCVVINHAAIMNGFDVLQAVSVKFGIDMPSPTTNDFLDSSLLSPSRPVYVVSTELRDRAIAVWDSLRELDVSTQHQPDTYQNIENELILDADGKLARAELLEIFAKTALRELEERHEAAKDTFWRSNKDKAEINRLRAEINRLQSRENRNVLLRFNANRPNRLAQMLSAYRNYAVLRKTNMFNAKWYLEQNPDVKDMGIDPLMHYIRFGASEGRDPSHSFATIRYLSLHEDVLDSGINPLLHFERFGRKEGRSH